MGYDGTNQSIYSINDFSGYYRVKLLTSKEQAFPKLRDYIINYLRYGKKLTELRLDNGKEFSPKKLKALAKEIGFLVILRAAYIPEQGGRIKRVGRSLVELARTAMIDTGLPLKLQLFTIRYTAKILNLLPDEKSNKSPNKVFRENIGIPIYKTLRFLPTFGYLALIYRKGGPRAAALAPKRSDKFAARTIDARFIELEGNHSHIYKVQVLKTN